MRMKIESPASTRDEVRAFVNPYGDREMQMLAARLQHVSNRLAELGPRVQAPPGDDSEWNAHEILAHLAVVSKFYGVLGHRVSSGQMSELNLLEAVNLRDPAGQRLAALDPGGPGEVTHSRHAQ